MKFIILLFSFLTFSFATPLVDTAISTGLQAVTAQNPDKNLAINNNDLSEFESEYQSKEIFDPLSGYNRVMTGFNDIIYRYAFTPVFKVYGDIMPAPAKTGINNFFNNLMFPIRFVNNLLQFKFFEAVDEVFSFTLNSTFGLGGFIEVSESYFGIKRHNEDFGQTLGRWGIGSGFPVVLPILGQSNLRDIFGIVGDYFANPLTYVDSLAGKDALENSYIGISGAGLRMLNMGGIQPNRYEMLTKDAIDLYPFMRNSYEQMRDAAIKE